jgi:hypothetical protein
MNELKENFFQVRDLTKIYKMGEVEVHALRVLIWNYTPAS